MLKNFWTPVIHEVLVCVQENENPHGLYIVAAKKGSLVVGHTLSCCLPFLQAGIITATVRDSHQYFSNSLQGGLEVPCVLRFCGELKNVDKIRTSK